MPIYEFACRGCGQRFEDLVRGQEVSRCPRCEGSDLQCLISTFAVPSSSSGGEPGPGCSPATGDPFTISLDGFAAGCARRNSLRGDPGSCGDPRGPGACATD